MLKMILAPVLGGIIGYITNDLAIKMLFRPRRAIYIGTFRLPFTPGLIPQQKARIAASVGSVVTHELLDADTLEQTFLSEPVLAAVRDRLEEILRPLASDEQPLRDRLSGYIGQAQVQHYEEQIRTRGAAFLSEKLVAADAGGTVVHAAMNALKERQTFGLLTRWMDESMAQALGGKINRLIEENGPTFLGDEIGRLEDDLLNRPVCELYQKYEEQINRLKERAVQLYCFVIRQKLREALSVLNLEQMITDKINAFSPEELEKLILDIMKKELRAIVYLGALLGFLMGFLNLLW